MGVGGLTREVLERPDVCYVLFRRKDYPKRVVLKLLRELGLEDPPLEEGAVFWRLCLRPVPKEATRLEFLVLGANVFALVAESDAPELPLE